MRREALRSSSSTPIPLLFFAKVGLSLAKFWVLGDGFSPLESCFFFSPLYILLFYILLRINRRSWRSVVVACLLLQDLERKAVERSAVQQWRLPMHQLIVQPVGSRTGGPRLSAARWRRPLLPLGCTLWRQSFMERALWPWAARIPDGVSVPAEAQMMEGFDFYCKAVDAKISIHFRSFICSIYNSNRSCWQGRRRRRK